LGQQSIFKPGWYISLGLPLLISVWRVDDRREGLFKKDLKFVLVTNDLHMHLFLKGLLGKQEFGIALFLRVIVDIQFVDAYLLEEGT
jgi:hypothetical protein